ncbi:MAG TPA: ATP-grasp domain-containing protein [Pilimelia sp.]|nr:ATP-grasp domain-containing protein [Pilimelia sp.]
MSVDRHVLMVGATDDAVHKAKDLGLHVLLLQHPDKLTPAQEEGADLLHVVDYTDWALVEPLARRLHVTPGFRCALSLTELGLVPAAQVNELLGLPGTPLAVARRMRDKRAMRAHLVGSGVNSVAAAPLRERADLDAFAAAHGYPLIVKPTNASASFGVSRADDPADLDAVWADVERLRGRRTDRGSTLFLIEDFLVEEYVDGPEVSVESVSFGGRHVVVAVTEKTVSPRFAELCHALPARLDPPVLEEIRDQVRRFLDRMGLRDGVCHTELRLGPRGPVVIESHNRVGGDAIPALVEAAYGVDLSRLALGHPFGLVDELPDHPVPVAAASTRFLVSPPGRVSALGGVDEARRQPDVLEVRINAEVGDTVRPLRDNWDRLGLVAVTAPDTDAAVRRGAALIDEQLDIRVTGQDGTTWQVTTAVAAAATGAAA